MKDKLRKLELFSTFSDISLEGIINLVAVQNIAEGDFVFTEGDTGDHFYIIEEGKVEISKESKVLNVFSTGEIFGEMSLFEDQARSASARALTPCVLYRIWNGDFLDFVSEHCEEGFRFLMTNLREMSRRLRSTTEYLMTVHDTGRIVGETDDIDMMALKIVKRLVKDIAGATGGMLMVNNPFSYEYEQVANEGFSVISEEDIRASLVRDDKQVLRIDNAAGAALGYPMVESDKTMGYVFISKDPGAGFSTEQEIIISSVASQIGLGLVNAYSKKEDAARQRLEQSRMWKY